MSRLDREQAKYQAAWCSVAHHHECGPGCEIAARLGDIADALAGVNGLTPGDNVKLSEARNLAEFPSPPPAPSERTRE